MAVLSLTSIAAGAVDGAEITCETVKLRTRQVSKAADLDMRELLRCDGFAFTQGGPVGQITEVLAAGSRADRIRRLRSVAPRCRRLWRGIIELPWGVGVG